MIATGNPTALVVEHLVKRYGALEAVSDISFEVASGEVFALIGPNGAGKTSTLRCVATLLEPSAGTISVGGHDVVRQAAEVREIISYLPEEAGAYKNMTGEAYLRFFAEIFFDSAARQKSAVATAREITDLGDRLADKLGSYSKGMTRKLLLARALMTSPTLAILDEPTSGLDVLNALEVRDIIRRFSDEGMAVLLSSHNMLEIEYLSDRVGLVYKGVLHDVGTPDELKVRYNAENLEQVFAEVAR